MGHRVSYDDKFVPLGEKTIPLPNAIGKHAGASIPAIGLGTYQSKPGEVEAAIKAALKAGYRHIDAAWSYNNHKEVGKAIKAAERELGIKRSEIFITSKIWVTYHDRVAEHVDDILGDLGLSYVDMMLVHWPVTLNPEGNDQKYPLREDGSRDHVEGWDLSDTWSQLEDLQRQGKMRHIGVSNFSQHYLDQILEKGTVKPAVNQIELHVYNPQHNLIDYCRSHGIVPQAYAPLGSSGSVVLKDETVLKLADKYNTSPAAILLGYLVAKDIVALPKSVTEARIIANKKPAHLSPADIDVLDRLSTDGGKQQRFFKPPWGCKMGFEDWEYADSSAKPKTEAVKAAPAPAPAPARRVQQSHR